MQSKNINIDFLYLDLNTCTRCCATDDSLKEALGALSGLFGLLGYTVNINKINILTKELAEKHHFLSSPTIRVNGIDICGEIKENDCADCGDLCGDSVDCRTFIYEGQDYEQPPAAMIADGILRAIYGDIKNIESSYALPDNLKNYYTRRDSTMKKMSIYEPAMCCETGLCGVSIDPELLRISTTLNVLKKNGVIVNRYNLSSAPMEFVSNETINKFVNEKGVDDLPAVMLDGEIIITGRYPSKEEFISLLEVPESYLTEATNENDCCGGSNSCC